MLLMSIGIMNGESRPGPRSSKILMLLGGRGQAADAGADDDADFVAVFLVEIEAGIEQRLMPGVDAELRIAVRAPDFLRRRKRRRGIKIFHLAGDLRVERRRVKGR